ncbi:Gfo/Idh/MocA family protein [Natrialba aegyptia]|uniref:Dehydrogenase n=1 Tax=Natrialba aegyptia DSM 13077 TaxID=1227491 RepID=M0AI18_9EURY|nr:Gfo/Idh/MocA family oxidoreductase [Natrialba aegyptia]ELY98360.1 dehydrogenase [Natrialba aegyptia DSM 13077]
MDLACVGAGIMGQRLLEQFDHHDNVRIVAICDLDEEAAREAAETRGATVYTDHNRLYQNESLDAVVLAIPSFAHTDQAIGAAKRGLDLFVEKPVARTTEKAAEIRTAIEKHGVISQSGYLSRYSPLVDRAEEVISDRTVSLIEGRYWGGVPGREWGREKTKSGGSTVQLSTHIFDLVRYFGGEVDHLAAVGGSRVNLESIDFEDVNSTTMKHENGIVSYVSTNCLTSVGRKLELAGEEFALEIDFTHQTLTGEIDNESIQYEPDDAASSLRREVDAFVDAVTGRDESSIRTDYADAARTLELTLAANEAIETGEPVSL